MGFIRLDGTIAGSLSSASFGKNKFGKDCLTLEGNWDGTSDRVLECPAWLGDSLTDLGVMGEDQGGVWVDSSKRVAITKSGKGAGNVRWEVADGSGATTNLAPAAASRPQSSRPQTPRPASAAPAQRPAGAGQVFVAEDGALVGPGPAARNLPNNRQQPPREDPAVTRRRIAATLSACIDTATNIWKAKYAPSEDMPATESVIQSTAATLFIEGNRLGLPLLPDPSAPPPVTDPQKNELKELLAAAVRHGKDEAWFGIELAKYGPKNALVKSMGTDQAKAAIIGIAGTIVKMDEEARIAAELAENAKRNDPPPPVGNDDSDIPF